MNMLLILLGLVIAINALTFVAFGIDKARAVRGEHRIPEAFLLKLSFLGGWFGAKLAQRHFRHKTIKQPFARRLNAVPVIWCIIPIVVVALHYLPLNVSGAFAHQVERQTPRFFQSVRN